MSFPQAHFVETNGIKMAVYEEGEGFPVILAHGWPELAYSWRHQIPALAEAGFRAIAPDQRGYGKTGAPQNAPQGEAAIPLYDMEHLTDDLIGLLDALQIEKAIFCGHDWGGLVVWQMPLLYPQRTAGVIGVNTPFIPRLSRDPIQAMREAMGEDMYIVFFQNYGKAEALLDKDVARALRFFYRKRRGKEKPRAPSEAEKNMRLFELLAQDEKTWRGEALMRDEDHQIYAQAFQATGFGPGINWYRNFTRNWEKSESLEQKVRCPSLMISAANDLALPPESTMGMEKYIPDLEKHLIEDCGHWTQQEKPEALNHLIIDWLKRRFS